ncbi:phosphotransferase family protein [[Mycobacterium] burgundiense]|uniref:Phosphotransferase family protein n=1 Tax=[Mycobacterium] burgundiense TaxID=3064286 RepID=A0ABM9LHW8_9MYCO|nr:phosphotransferase family protein [Mycolicibacterium sp. MU0053]CAJ1499286.1 phosphotransferase family protein [Mycolicibacterium sp. MU0053]
MTGLKLAIDDAVDLAAVSAWLRTEGLGEGSIEDPQLLAGGTQNILLRLQIDGRSLVFRRPPLRPRPRNNELILREATVLKALAATSVPHARLVAVCDDPSVLGSAVFYLMEAVDGFNPAEEVPEAFRSQHGREHLVYQATDALAEIGSLDHEIIGLANFGKPQDFLERQVPRWVAERDKYLGMDGYDGTSLPHFEDIRDYLAATVPAAFRLGLMHGDYHLGNLIFEHRFGTLAAVLDWEMSTIGDPLLDLGRYLATWPDQHEVIMDAGGIWSAGELPSPEEVAARYCARSGRPDTDLRWYVVMGCFKLGIILEGTYARSCAGLAPSAIGSALHNAAVLLFERAGRLSGVR